MDKIILLLYATVILFYVGCFLDNAYVYCFDSSGKTFLESITEMIIQLLEITYSSMGSFRNILLFFHEVEVWSVCTLPSSNSACEIL